MTYIEDHENKYWTFEKLEGETRNHTKRFDKIIEFITRDNRTDKILDAGCGTGWIARKLKDRQYPAPIMNVDIRQEYVDKLKTMGFEAAKGDVRNLSFPDRSFDLVCANEILEHLKTPGKALDECLRVAKKRAIFTIPINRSTDDFHAWLIKGEIVNGTLVIEFERTEWDA